MTMKRNMTINICLYKEINSLEVLPKAIYKILEITQDLFKVNPSGYGCSRVNKLRKLSEGNLKKIYSLENINSISVYFGGEQGVNNDWQVLVTSNHNHLSFIYNYDFNIKAKEMLQNVLINILRNNVFEYGFINYLPFNLLPDCYNDGVVGNDWPALEMEKMRSWNINSNRKDGKYQPGDLRDVYPYNIISDLHLNRDVHGQTLESWIKSDRRHGALEKLTQTHWLWTIEDEHIPDAQDVLSRANLLVAYWELGK